YDRLPICETSSRNPQCSLAIRQENHTRRFGADSALCQNRSNESASVAVVAYGKYSSLRAQAARTLGAGGSIGPKLRSSLKLSTSSSRPACLRARRNVPAALSPNTIWSIGFGMMMDHVLARLPQFYPAFGDFRARDRSAELVWQSKLPTLSGS